MISPRRIQRILLATILGGLAATSARSDDKPRPEATIDLKQLGIAPDLFSDQSDAKYQQRVLLTAFWIGNDRLAAAFNTTRRWSGSEKPEPLTVRLVVFDRTGKQLNTRDWSFSDEGPAAESTLQITSGPDQSILAIHQSTTAETDAQTQLPEGNFVQVLNPDTSLQQDFYIPATNAYVPGILSDSRLVLQTFYADRHVSLTWWSGHPLKPGPVLDLPHATGTTLAGPEVAARADCITGTLCSGIRIFRIDAPQWYSATPAMDITPIPRAFLTPTSLLVELRPQQEKKGQLLVVHPDGTHTQLPALPKGLQVLGLTGVARDGQRFSLDASGEAGMCGPLALFCKDRAESLVVDVRSDHIVFEQEVSPVVAISALSPDGHQLAILDKARLSIYPVP